MPILKQKKKKEAKSTAEKLASQYNIKYGDDGKTFTIHAKDDPTGKKGRTSFMVDAERWPTSLSRKKRLTTKYFQELAEKQNIEAIQKRQQDLEAKTIGLQELYDAEKLKSLELEKRLTEKPTKQGTTASTVTSNKTNFNKRKQRVSTSKQRDKSVTEKSFVGPPVSTETKPFSFTPSTEVKHVKDLSNEFTPGGVKLAKDKGFTHIKTLGQGIVPIDTVIKTLKEINIYDKKEYADAKLDEHGNVPLGYNFWKKLGLEDWLYF